MPATRRGARSVPETWWEDGEPTEVAHGWLSVERWLEPVARASTRTGALKRSRPAPRPAPAAALSRIERWEMAGMAPRIGSDSSHLPSLGEPAFENAQVSGLLVLVEPVAAGLARLSAAARTPESVSATVVQVSHACSRGRLEQPWRG